MASTFQTWVFTVGNEVPIAVAGAVLLVLGYLGWSHDQDPMASTPAHAVTAVR